MVIGLGRGTVRFKVNQSKLELCPEAIDNVFKNIAQSLIVLIFSEENNMFFRIYPMSFEQEYGHGNFVPAHQERKGSSIESKQESKAQVGNVGMYQPAPPPPVPAPVAAAAAAAPAAPTYWGN